MNKLNEMIQKLCPDGVEYKTLSAVARVERGKRVVREQLSTEEGFPVFQNSLTPMGYHTEYNYEGETTYIIGAGAAGEIGYSTERFWAADDCFPIVCDQEIHSRYIFHVLKWQQGFLKSKVRKASIPRLARDIISNLTIPVPPLPVQDEIVRILDNLAELTENLAICIETEHRARKTQYEFHRDRLLKFTGDVPQVKLGDYFPQIRNGFVGTATPYFTTADNGIRYLKGTNIHDGIISDNDFCYIKPEFHQKHIRNELKLNDILMVQSGHVGECAVVTEQYVGANCHALIIMSNGGNCNSKYVVHYLHTTEGKKKLAAITTGETVKHILASEMKKFTIPFPPLEEQNRIVSILDRLNSDCNYLASDLIAEIKARQKQYEYYRDKLLSFKAKE